VIHLVVVVGHLLTQLTITFHQRLERALELLLNQPAHLQGPTAYRLQLFVELA